jgi:uncharacterized membrane protein YkvA (DUF1232 family)
MKQVKNEEEIQEYGKHYSEEKFTDKMLKMAKKAGVKVVYAAYLLYYVLIDKTVLIKDKAIIIGALGYFILPFDLIPDFIPVIGFADDLTALVMAVKAVSNNITPEISQKAKAKVVGLFGTVDEVDFQLW